MHSTLAIADLVFVEVSGSGTVIEPLFALEREDATGVLEFQAREIVTRVFVRGGEIIFAEGGTVSETLGRLLIRCGRLTEEEVAAVLRRMTDSLGDNHDIRFGEVAVEYGFLSADELDVALTQQVKEKVMGCVHRGAGEWTFTKDDPRIEEVGSIVVGSRPMLVEATLHLPERRIEDILRLDENRYPEVVAPEAVLIEEFELSNAEAAILRELDGTSSLHFILSTTKSPNTPPLIAALVLGGGVELRKTPTGTRQSSEGRSVPPEFRAQRRARPSSANEERERPNLTSTLLSERGGSKHSATTLAVAYAAPDRRPSSRQNLTPASTEAQERSRAALERLKVDLETRKPVSSRRQMPVPKDDKERRLMAESAFHRGRIYLRSEDAERALPGLHRAFELRPEEREYELYMKWAQLLVNDAFKNDAQRAELQVLASRIVRENRDCELAFSVLGHCTMHDGKDEAALRFFQRATTLDPKLIDAARLARLLAMRSDSGHRKQMASKSDFAPGRSRLRGLLATPLDEIVPGPLRTAADNSNNMQRMVSSPSLMSDPKTTTTSGDAAKRALLGGAPGSAAEGDVDIPLSLGASKLAPGLATERLVTPFGTPTPARASAPTSVDRRPLSIPPPPNTPRAYPPPPSIPPPRPDLRISRPEPDLSASASASTSTSATEQQSQDKTTQNEDAQKETQVMATQPLPLLSGGALPPPPRLPTSTLSQPASSNAATTAGPSMTPHARSAAPPFSPSRAPAFSIPDPPPTKRRAGIVFVWIVSLGLTGGLAYYLGSRDGQQQHVSQHAPTSVSALASGGSNNPPTTTTTTTTTTTIASTPPTLSSAAGSANPTTTPSAAPPGLGASPSPTNVGSNADAGTGTLRTRRAYGRRIFVDGRIVGEGGPDLTVPCGVHRVRVGSAGVERSMTIPCGSSIELD